jgi:putative Ca2+/H+ antiporter (TMEM165/GDT1 family)
MLPTMEAFFVSAGIVALAEIGDKTQLLAIVLSARYRRPLPIIAGILFATIANHALAGLVGRLVMASVSPTWLKLGLAAAFAGMAVWILIPDTLEESETTASTRFGIFGTTVIAFFLAEMGDKTQIATVALAARYSSVLAVVSGTTIGMLLANVPAVFLGNRLAERLPVRLVHGVAAAIFAVLAIMVWMAPVDALVH